MLHHAHRHRSYWLVRVPLPPVCSRTEKDHIEPATPRCVPSIRLIPHKDFPPPVDIAPQMRPTDGEARQVRVHALPTACELWQVRHVCEEVPLLRVSIAG